MCWMEKLSWTMLLFFSVAATSDFTSEELSFPSPFAAPQISCVLPEYVTRMPVGKADELKKIWSNYTEGDCDWQQKETFSLLATLTPEEREEILEPKEVIVKDSFDTIPQFIASLTPEIRREFDAIWMDTKLMDNERHRKLAKLAALRFSREQRTGFDEWIKEVRRAKSEVERRIAGLSEKAKALLKKVNEVRAAHAAILAELTPELSHELRGLI